MSAPFAIDRKHLQQGRPGLYHAVEAPLPRPRLPQAPQVCKLRSVHLGSLGLAREGRGLQFYEFDALYVEKLKAGDSQTQEHFVDYFSELIQLKLRSRLSSKEAIEDVRQETFVRVLKILQTDKGLKQPDRLGAFVNSVCNHVLLEQYRSAGRTDPVLEEESQETFVNEGPSALNILETKDTERVVRQILEQLPERDRLLLQSVLLEERSKDEVCAEFGITREYLRVLLHRAKQTFKVFYISQLGETRMY